MTDVKKYMPEEIYFDTTVCKYTVRDQDGKIEKQFIRKQTENDIKPESTGNIGIKPGKFYGEWVDNTEAAITEEISAKKLNRQKTAEQRERLERARELKRANEMLAVFEKLGIKIEKKV